MDGWCNRDCVAVVIAIATSERTRRAGVDKTI